MFNKTGITMKGYKLFETKGTDKTWLAISEKSNFPIGEKDKHTTYGDDCSEWSWRSKGETER